MILPEPKCAWKYEVMFTSEVVETSPEVHKEVLLYSKKQWVCDSSAFPCLAKLMRCQKGRVVRMQFEAALGNLSKQWLFLYTMSELRAENLAAIETSLASLATNCFCSIRTTTTVTCRLLWRSNIKARWSWHLGEREHKLLQVESGWDCRWFYAMFAFWIVGTQHARNSDRL